MIMDMTEKTLESEIVYDGKIMTVKRDKVELVNGDTSYREIVLHNGGATIAALTDDDEFLLVRQYRYACGGVIYELPAGKLEKGEDPARCAARELEEETGYVADKIELLTAMLPTPGYSSEHIYVYKATGLRKTAQRLDDDEFLEVEKIKRSDALKMIKDNVITDAKTIVGILLT